MKLPLGWQHGDDSKPWDSGSLRAWTQPPPQCFLFLHPLLQTHASYTHAVSRLCAFTHAPSPYGTRPFFSLISESQADWWQCGITFQSTPAHRVLRLSV